MLLPLLDRNTLQVVVAVASVVTLAVMLNIWHINRDSPGMRWWLAAAAMATLGFLAIPLTLALAGPGQLRTGIALSHLGSMTMLLLLLAGALRFRGWLRTPRHTWGLLLIVPVALMAFANRNHDIRRYLMHDALSVLLLLLTAATLVWRRPEPERRVLGLAAFFVGLMALALAARWGVAWQASDGPSVLYHPIQGWIFLAIITFLIGWTYCVSLVCYQRAQSQVLRLAHQDALTQLPNRRYFDDMLDRDVARGERTGQAFALVMIDLNGFKQVNDQHGHPLGDALLAEVGRRLQAHSRGGDFVARLGGDEFAVLVHDVDGLEALAQAQERLRANLNGPVTLLGVPLQIDASLGAALWPVDSAQPGELMARADQRMYADKRRHKAERAAAVRRSSMDSN